MARPRFHVQHFVACLNAVCQGPAGPRTHRDLEGVGFTYAVPPGTEAPEFPELWLYSRLYLTNGVVGTRRLSIEVARTSELNDAPAYAIYEFDPVVFRSPGAVLNVAWPLRPLQFPALGDYEIRLVSEFKTWQGTEGRVVAREYVRIEYQR